MLCVTVTCKHEDEAEHIGRLLLEKKLVACANVFPVSSQFWWKGKIERRHEHMLSCKTVSEKLAAVQKEIKKLHSYELPVISVWDEKTTADVEKWIKGELA
jgi:periplasmic divalent cation tolerance protein